MDSVEVRNEFGIVCISDQVIAAIARRICLGISGILAMDDSFSHGLPSVIAGDEAEGVRVSIKNNGAYIDIFVVVKYGIRVPALALEVQEKVREGILENTGTVVHAVNINVQNIEFQ